MSILSKSYGNYVSLIADNCLFCPSENLKIEYLKQLEMVLDSCIKCKHKVTILCQAAREATARAQDETTGEPKADLFDEVSDQPRFRICCEMLIVWLLYCIAQGSVYTVSFHTKPHSQ